MQKKVLIIDDSALMRRAISDIINSDEKLTVTDMANNGKKAMELLRQGNRYDIILLDIQMPIMNGVEFLRAMKEASFRMPVLVVSSIAGKDASETIEALELGAFDFVRKPTGGQLGTAFSVFHDEIMEKVYVGCHLGVYRLGVQQHKKEDKPAVPDRRVIRPRTSGQVKGKKLAVIASSTGGPKALQTVVPMFPANFPYPLVIVQHMPAAFTKSLAERLNEMSLLHVKEAEDGEYLQAGTIYIAQGGKQCELVEKSPGKYQIWENDKPPRGGLKPCADIFLESLVDVSFEEIVCGVLTGMGSDGTKGIQRLKKNKKIKVVAQDEATCVVYGMPRAVYVAGVVDAVVPLDKVTGTMIKQLGV